MNERRARLRWLSPAVLGFGLASFLSDAGHEAATSAMPLLLATLGSAPAALGLIEGVADAAASFAKLGGGWLADRPHLRKPIAVLGYLITGLSKGAYALATAWYHVLFARTAGWIARGVRGPARDAMLADAVPQEALGRAFGFHRAMDTAGAVAGPAFAALLLSRVSLKTVFLWAMVPGVLAAIAFAVLVRPKRELPKPPVPFWRSLGALPHSFRAFLVAVFVFGVGDFARTLLILRATQLLAATGDVHAATTAMWLYAFYNVVYALASYPIGHLADRLSPRQLLVIGYALGGVTALLAAFATASLVLLVALFAVAGLTVAFQDTLEGTITATLVDSSLRGTAYGVLATVNGVGDLLSSIVVGVLWSAVGPGVAFGGAAALCVGGALVLEIAVRKGATAGPS